MCAYCDVKLSFDDIMGEIDTDVTTVQKAKDHIFHMETISFNSKYFIYILQVERNLECGIFAQQLRNDVHCSCGVFDICFENCNHNYSFCGALTLPQ